MGLPVEGSEEEKAERFFRRPILPEPRNISLGTELLYRLDVNALGARVGYLYFLEYSEEPHSCCLYLYIEEKYRKRWLSRKCREDILSGIKKVCGLLGIKKVFSFAEVPVSNRLLPFFGFKPIDIANSAENNQNTGYYTLIDP